MDYEFLADLQKAERATDPIDESAALALVLG